MNGETTSSAGLCQQVRSLARLVLVSSSEVTVESSIQQNKQMCFLYNRKYKTSNSKEVRLYTLV